MIILLHVLIALTSIGVTSYAYFRPTSLKLRVSYGLVGLTLASGIYLVLSMPAHMVQACTSGFVYLGIVTVGIMMARARLDTQNADKHVRTQ